MDYPAFEADLRQLAPRGSVTPRNRSGVCDMDSKATAAGGFPISACAKRAFRDYVAQRVQAPELSRPPLDALPAEQAVRELGRQLLEKCDWPRLHDCSPIRRRSSALPWTEGQ